MVVPDLARLARWGLGLLLVPLVVVLVGVQAGTPDRGASRLGDGLLAPGRAGRDHGPRGTGPVPVPSFGIGIRVAGHRLVALPVGRPVSDPARGELRPPMPDDSRAGSTHPPIVRPRLRPHVPEPIQDTGPGMPPRQRDFSLMVRDGDVTSASNYLAVRGVLRAVGKRVQVYVAAEDLDRVDPELLKDLVATFDDQIVPVAARSVGLATDIDGDGRFTVLLSSWLSRLGNGRHAVDGFVRVTDLDPAFPAPFGNRCDMMYLSTGLKPGPHLRTVLAHEYMHAVVFSRKSRQSRDGRADRARGGRLAR